MINQVIKVKIIHMSREKIKLFIIAGEVSGDFLGAKIIEHFRTLLQEHDIE